LGVEILKRFLQCKRGVSEIIGSLIIILIVTIAGVAVYAYSLNAISVSSSELNQQTQVYSELAQERFEVIKVWNNSSQFRLTVLNFGKIDFAVDAVYINGVAVEVTSGGGETVGVGELVTVEFNSPITFSSGDVLRILVVSERGGRNTVLHPV
jgi:flagellin-like protein